jgi:hypothetical protein
MTNKARATVFSSAPTRVRAPVQAYSHYYWKDKLRSIVHERYKRELIQQGVREEDDDTPLIKIPLLFQTNVVAELYSAESDEFKAQLDIRRKAEKSSAADELDDTLRRQKLEKYQR